MGFHDSLKFSVTPYTVRRCCVDYSHTIALTQHVNRHHKHDLEQTNTLVKTNTKPTTR